MKNKKKGIKKSWKSLKYWQKGSIIGTLISAFLLILSYIISYLLPSFYEKEFSVIPIIGSIAFGIPLMLGFSFNILKPCMDFCPILHKGLYILIIITFWTLIGMLIGFIIQKIREK